MSDVDKWYRNYWARLKIRDSLYQTLRAPCLSWEDTPGLNECQRMIFDHTRHAKRLLDFGGGNNRLKKKFLAAGFGGKYETLDISAEEQHEYRSLGEITGQFDAILCLEVIEHMTLNDYVDLMDAFGSLLAPGGVLVISTPNPLCVVPMWVNDAGHVQQYPQADLAADLVLRGHDVEAFRVRHGAWPRGPRPRLRFFATRVLCYLLNVDYAHGIVVIGKKKCDEQVGDQSV